MIGLIDADHILYVCLYNKKDEPVKSLEACILNVDHYIRNIITKLYLTEVHLFLTIGRGYRYNVFPEYKANRIGNIKPDFFIEVRDYLIKEYKAIYLKDDLEADDFIGIYKAKYDTEHKPYTTISTDKDILNLYGSNYNPVKDEYKIVFSSHENEYFWKSMITGDTSDGIKGIPKKGEKFADKLFEQCLDKKNEEKTFELFREKLLTEYIKYFGEENGIIEFYKNYRCLKIKTSYEGLEFQEPIKVKDIYARTLGVVG